MIVLLGGGTVGKPFSISQMTRAKPVCAMAWRENVVAKQQPLPILLLRMFHRPVVEIAPLREYCRPDQPCVVDAFHHRRQVLRVVSRLLPVGRNERVPAIHLEPQRPALLWELLRVEEPVVSLCRRVELQLEVINPPLRELRQRKLRCGGSGHFLLCWRDKRQSPSANRVDIKREYSSYRSCQLDGFLLKVFWLRNFVL